MKLSLRIYIKLYKTSMIFLFGSIANKLKGNQTKDL